MTEEEENDDFETFAEGFDELLDPNFHNSPGPKEASAGERVYAQRAAAARRARQEALSARLEEERRDGETADRKKRHVDRRRSAGRAFRGVMIVALLAVIGVAAFLMSPSGSEYSLFGLNDNSDAPRPDDWPPKDTSAAEESLGTPPQPPSGEVGAFEFLDLQPDGSGGPVAWDPCRPVRYVVNPAGAPAGGMEMIEQAVARTAAATGLRFEYVGETGERPDKERELFLPHMYDDRWAPALFAWATEDEFPDLAGYTTGIATPVSVTFDGEQLVFVTGQVVLDPADFTEILEVDPQGEDVVLSIVQHEVGHLVGLGHVADDTQVMYSETMSDPTKSWGTGDLTGLSALGSGDCFPLV